MYERSSCERRVEGKDDRYYIEKAGMLDKYENIPEELQEILSYSQFVKRYDRARTVPKAYQENKEEYKKYLDIEVTEEMERAGDYIFDGNSEPHRLISLPELIPVSDITDPDNIQWMKRRNPKVLRFHKFKERTEPHQHYYSEMQLFLPFQQEEDLFPNDVDQCREKYFQNKGKINCI